MKATLATLACLLTVGFLSAAEVKGNNTAVVIRKEVVQSDTGFQFLCVPVDGLSINGASTGKIKLSTLLPAGLTVDGTVVTLVGKVDANGQPITYRFSGGAWDKPNDELDGGQIFWVQAGSTDDETLDTTLSLVDESAEGDNGNPSPETIVFCGQERTVEAVKYSDLQPGLIVALKNDTSRAISLNEVVDLAGADRTNDTVMTIEEGSSNYKQYFYRKGKWRATSATSTIAQEVNGDADIIAPGEAFYYYKAKAAN